MKFVCVLAVAVLLLILLPACSHLPRMPEGAGSDAAALRQAYFEAHPDGEFNECIRQGEVVRGMNVIEVLASWGVPNMRRAYAHATGQYWTYFVVDDASRRVMSYELVFDDRVLERWNIAQSVLTIDKLPPEDLSGMAPAIPTEFVRSSGLGDGKLKK